jgi:hypothetical protein
MLSVDVVIANHPVGAQRRRMTGSSKQSISQLAEAWIASSLSLLAMTIEKPRRRSKQRVVDPVPFHLK